MIDQGADMSETIGAQNQTPQREQPMAVDFRQHVEVATTRPRASPAVFDLEELEVHYGAFRAVRDVTMKIRKNQITSFIGPSGCGKTTVLRCLNRMNDVIPAPASAARSPTTASISTGPNVSATEVRRRIGMVFQRPNPFPKSIYDNVAYGPRSTGSA